jgi:hypothetical protein
MTTDSEALGERISIGELADELQCRRQSLFKIVARLGIEPTKEKKADRGGQQVAMVTPEEAMNIRKEFLLRMRGSDQPDAGEPFLVNDGVFYLIQLEPDHDPGRIKLGFTTDLDGRLQKHRCSAPFAKLLRTWPCRRVWERAAMDCIAAGIEQLHTEVFRAPSIEDVTKRANSFFEIMPKVVIGTEEEAE